MRNFKNWLIYTSLISLLVACTVNPVTGKRQLSLVSAQQELAIGEQNYAPSQQAQGGRYIIDPDLQVYVNQVGQKLAAVSDRPDLPYEFVVLNNSVPNAWALPGGKIAINRGLLTELQDESELAAVLGHEIVHAAARHTAQQMTRSTLLGVGVTALAIGTSDSNYGALTGVAASIGVAAWLSKYGRDAELESDAYGMEYMSRAGYDPMGAVRLQETFVKLSEGNNPDFISGLFASHPPSRERVNANRIKAQGLSGSIRNETVYKQKIAQLIKDAPAYEAQDEAIKALNNKQAAQALSLLDKAVAIQPNESYFWELRGHAWEMQDNPDNAEKAFTTAIGKNPEYYSPYLARGTLRYQQGNKTAAKADLEKSYKLLPTQQASYLLGELNAASSPTEALGYYQQAASLGGTMGTNASQRAVELEFRQNPSKYLLSQAGYNQQGYLVIVIANQTHKTVTDINLQFTNTSTNAGPQQLGISGSLQAGEQRQINTGLGPFTQPYPNIVVQVQSARLTD